MADARAFCPGLRTVPADPVADDRFLAALRRWAMRYCPWVGFEGGDGLVLDITGAAHLHGGEAAMLADMRRHLARTGIGVMLGLGDTRGAAWALAHHGEGVAAPGQSLAGIGHLPVAALRLDGDAVIALQRLGLRRIAELDAAPRAPLARRFGMDLLRRLDQALDRQPEQISPAVEPPHFAARLTLPEPIGLVSDVMAGTARLLDRLCLRLKQAEAGARILHLTLHRVDHDSRLVELRLAAPLRDPARILPLFLPGVASADAGFGIDLMRLHAVVAEPLPVHQISHVGRDTEGLDDLVTRIGTRIGLDNIQRFLPAESHIPERGFTLATAAFSRAEGPFVTLRPRPFRLFLPEPVAAPDVRLPTRFHWRGMLLTTARASGPERIAPAWWVDDPAWRSGIRDYWRVETTAGRRLWLFHTPQSSGWFTQGEFA